MLYYNLQVSVPPKDDSFRISYYLVKMIYLERGLVPNPHMALVLHDEWRAYFGGR
ncbi:hypothetical protein PILCRDRAFT_810423 [Piloderma croceum F 1598]|uniref:Uncharacterized protein n=1 Tax=Piloderma croceum (strain F 1598) TaxID=765440 RepID=A0A0C3C0J9_PILCF|nr:hypothetical protein PILCRDRAFT_810423 [Piloderma croceum F 1598]